MLPPARPIQISNAPAPEEAIRYSSFASFRKPSDMQPNKSMHPRARLSSFGYAIRGIGSLIRQEPNAMLHVMAAAIAVVFGLFRHISHGQWLALVIVIALVWIAEAFNTCIEMLCDLWCKGEYHPQVKRIKDISAAAVLIASVSAVAAGVIIFLL
jgi:diacylglycerol kinase